MNLSNKTKKAQTGIILNGKQKSRTFDPILIDSIDEALESLGESVKESVYFLLEHRFSIVKQDIPDRIGDFSTAIEQVFGSCARQFKVLIAEILRKRVSHKYPANLPDMLVAGLLQETQTPEKIHF